MYITSHCSHESNHRKSQSAIMGLMINPFKKHHVDDFKDIFQPLSECYSCRHDISMETKSVDIANVEENAESDRVALRQHSLRSDNKNNSLATDSSSSQESAEGGSLFSYFRVRSGLSDRSSTQDSTKSCKHTSQECSRKTMEGLRAEVDATIAAAGTLDSVYDSE